MMGWSIGYDEKWQRDVGYGVPAYCDHPGCAEEIDRGLSYVCGSDMYGGEHGCGLYFCAKHLHIAGDARGNVSLCTRCRYGKASTYPAKPDHPDWMRHQLTDESWGDWRNENPDLVAAIREALKEHDHA